jgi:hypothetical protein
MPILRLFYVLSCVLSPCSPCLIVQNESSYSFTFKFTCLSLRIGDMSVAEIAAAPVFSANSTSKVLLSYSSL